MPKLTRCFAQVALSSLKQGQGESALQSRQRCAELGQAAEFNLTLVMVLVELVATSFIAELHKLAGRLVAERRFGEAKTTCLKILQLARTDAEARLGRCHACMLGW